MDKLRQRTLTLWLRQQSRLVRPWLSLTVLLGGLSAGLLIAQAWLLASLLHPLIMATADKQSLLPGFLGLVALALLRAALVWGREQSAFQAGSRLRRHLRARVLEQLRERGPAYLQQRAAGNWASLLLEQIEHLHDFYARYLSQSRLAVLQPLLILVAVFPVNWACGLILLLTAPLIPFFMILTGIGAADANRRNFKALARLSGHFLDRLKGLATLRLYHAAAAEGKQIEQASEQFRERTMEVLRLAFLSSAVLEFFAALSIALVAVYFGFSYLEHLNFGHYGEPLTLFTGLYVLLLAPEFYLPLRELGTHYHAKAQAIGAADSLEQFLGETPLTPTAGVQPFDSAEPLHIEARELCVLSPAGQVLVGPLSFTLAAGSHTALVGKTGSGKSSLLSALLGFAPYRGSLRINGQELSHLDQARYRLHVGWLGQTPKLLHGSLRDNLTLGRQDRPQAELLAALRQAGADDILAAKGWDYAIGEQGRGLSVGQAQRLALARTLLKPCRLLLLDEPTASLDKLNEQKIMTALQAQLRGRTSLLVTHRRPQLQQAEQILVLEQGQLVACGDFESLNLPGSPLHRLLQSDAGVVTTQATDEATNGE